MIRKKTEINTKNFHLQRLKDDRENKALISSFTSQKNNSLASYLRYHSWRDDQINTKAIYLVKDGMKIVLFFSLQCGVLIKCHEKKIKGIIHNEKNGEVEYHIDSDIIDVSKVVPAIEISHFCVNDSYKKKKSEWRVRNNVGSYRVGEYCFYKYIAPQIIEVSNKVGAEQVYLFCADNGDEKLLEYYYSIGFNIMDDMACIRSNYENKLKCLTQKISDLKYTVDLFNDEEKIDEIIKYLQTNKKINRESFRTKFHISNVSQLIDKMIENKLIKNVQHQKNSYELY